MDPFDLWKVGVHLADGWKACADLADGWKVHVHLDDPGKLHGMHFAVFRKYDLYLCLNGQCEYY